MSIPLTSHVVAFDERRSSPLTNLGTLGATGDATATGTKVLAWAGTRYAYSPLVSSNGFTITDPSDLSGATELDVRLVLQADDWSAATNQYLISQSNGTAASSSFEVWLATTGGLRIQTSDGASFTAAAAGTSLDGSGLIAVKITWTTTAGAVAYYSKSTTEATALTDIASNSGWTAKGTGTAGTAALPNSSLVMGIMNRASLNGATGGTIYAAQVATTIDGAPFFKMYLDQDLRYADDDDSSFTATSGQTVTVARSTGATYHTELVTGPNSQSRLFNGTSDLLTVADNAALDFGASDSFTAWALVRQWGTPTSFGRFIDKRNTGAPFNGWTLTSNGTNRSLYVEARDGTDAPSDTTTATTTAGALTLIGIQVDRGNTKLAGFIDGTIDAGASSSALDSMASTSALIVGATAASASFQHFRLFAWGVYAGAMTAAQLVALKAALIAGPGSGPRSATLTVPTRTTTLTVPGRTATLTVPSRTVTLEV